MDLADPDWDDIFTIPFSIIGNSLTDRCQLSVQDSLGI